MAKWVTISLISKFSRSTEATRQSPTKTKTNTPHWRAIPQRTLKSGTIWTTNWDMKSSLSNIESTAAFGCENKSQGSFWNFSVFKLNIIFLCPSWRCLRINGHSICDCRREQTCHACGSERTQTLPEFRRNLCLWSRSTHSLLSVAPVNVRLISWEPLWELSSQLPLQHWAPKKRS